MKTPVTFLVFCSIFVANIVVAGNDASIKGELRSNIKAAMLTYVTENTIKGQYVIYDSKKGELKRLKMTKLHDGIVKKGEFFVSCADFVDQQGKVYDLDFLVSPNGNGHRVIQAIIHAENGNKRKYHIEG